MNSLRNNTIRLKGIIQDSSELLKISSTQMNSIMDTASFIIPSPNTTLNSLGYLSGFIIVNAATQSEAHTVAEKIIIYSIFNVMISSLLVTRINSFYLQN